MSITSPFLYSAQSHYNILFQPYLHTKLHFTHTINTKRSLWLPRSFSTSNFNNRNSISSQPIHNFISLPSALIINWRIKSSGISNISYAFLSLSLLFKVITSLKKYGSSSTTVKSTSGSPLTPLTHPQPLIPLCTNLSKLSKEASMSSSL